VKSSIASKPSFEALAIPASKSSQKIHGPVLICGTKAMVTQDFIISLFVKIYHYFNYSLLIQSPICQSLFRFIDSHHFADYVVYREFTLLQVLYYFWEFG